MSLAEGADSVVWLALDAPQGLTGRFIRDRREDRLVIQHGADGLNQLRPS